MNTAWKRNFIAYQTLSRREIRRFTRIWSQTLLPPIIMTVLYFLIFGKLIGSRVGTVEGVSYIEFISPGLIMMAVITNAYSNVSSSFFSTKHHKNIEEQLVSSMPDILIVCGFVTGGILRALIVGAIVAAVSACFTDIRVESFVMTLSIACITAIVFSLAGFINGLYAKTFDDVNLIPTFVLTPLTYLSGVFYSVSMLSPFWQTVAQFNPLLYVISGFRQGMLGASGISFTLTMTGLIMLATILTALALYMMRYTNCLRK